MNVEFFIALRQYKYSGKSKLSSSVSGIAVFGIALCIVVMIVSTSIVTGFKQEISNKVIGFGSHIQIINYDSNSSYETNPISNKQPFLRGLKETDGIAHIQQYALKAGIIKTQNDIQGVVLKGVGSDFDWSFFSKYLIAGKTFEVNDSSKTNEILISNYIAQHLKLKVGDNFAMYFVQDPPRMRKFTISGIYETSFEEMDKLYVLCDIGHIRKLNDWKDDQITGFEVHIDNFSKLDQMYFTASDTVGVGLSADGTVLRVENIKQRYPQIFDWLALQDVNVMIILILMLAVAGFNMISGLLVLILDKVRIIGILKAIGGNNLLLRKIFLYHSGFLIVKGLFWGNVIGLGFCYLQKYTHIFKLDQTSYYISYVPINIDLSSVLMLNFGAMLAILISLLLPSMVISRLNPIDSIRYS